MVFLFPGSADPALPEKLEIACALCHIGVEGIVDEGVVVSPLGPGALCRDSGKFGKPPVNGGSITNSEEVPDGRRDVDACALVHFVLGGLLTEDVFPVVGDPWSAIFPLGVANFFCFRGVNLDPSALADGVTRLGVVAIPPWNDPLGLGFVVGVVEAVVVGERDVKRILFRREGRGDKAITRGRIRIVVSSVIFCPFLVPGRFIVGCRIVRGGFFTNPKDGCRDVLFPRVQGSLSLNRIGSLCDHGNFRAVLSHRLRGDDRDENDSSEGQRGQNRGKISEFQSSVSGGLFLPSGAWHVTVGPVTKCAVFIPQNFTSSFPMVTRFQWRSLRWPRICSLEAGW